MLRVDPANSSHIYVAGDGGLHESFDMGKTYIRVNNIPVAQIYRIAVDNRDPYWVYVGLQDNHSFMGPSATRHWLGILNQDWVRDRLQRRHRQSRRQGRLAQGLLVVERRQPLARRSDDRRHHGHHAASARGRAGVSLRLGRAGDGVAAHRRARCISAAIGCSSRRTTARRGRARKDLTRSINRDTLEMMGVLNRDIRLSRNDGDNISEISNFAESPLDPKILWVGTDDGNVQLTTDGGATWTELSGAITGVKNGTFVGDIVASGASRGTAYVSFDAHRDGDFAPYIFRTTDFGKTWTAVVDRPARRRCVGPQPGRVSRASRTCCSRAPSARCSSRTTAARTGRRLAGNLPTTRYDDIVVHPRTKDLVLGTHGRGIWILDDASPIAEWTPAIAAKRAHLFACRARR